MGGECRAEAQALREVREPQEWASQGGGCMRMPMPGCYALLGACCWAGGCLSASRAAAAQGCQSRLAPAGHGGGLWLTEHGQLLV